MKNPKFNICWSLASVSLGLIADTLAQTREPTLVIESQQGQKIVYTRSQLLLKPGLKKIVVNQDPAYQNQKRVYTAIPAYQLFQNIPLPPEASILFQCKDGFSAPVNREQFLNRSLKKGSVAYLAIEEKDHRWPQKPLSAGPFYLIWDHPEISNITQEEWPFQLTGFIIKNSIREIYPNIFPDEKLGENTPVHRGFKVFMKNCFVCHRINQQGEGRMGPDLNIPMNPTEYFKEEALNLFIRSSKNLRTWPSLRMTDFSKETISDFELKDLIEYLKHMAKRKVKSSVIESQKK